MKCYTKILLKNHIELAINVKQLTKWSKLSVFLILMSQTIIILVKIIICLMSDDNFSLFCFVDLRSSTIKYLRQSNVKVKWHHQKTMSGLLGKFSLKEFDKFFNNYKVKNTLSQEALTVLECFILALNEFFDLWWFNWRNGR